MGRKDAGAEICKSQNFGFVNAAKEFAQGRLLRCIAVGQGSKQSNLLVISCLRKEQTTDERNRSPLTSILSPRAGRGGTAYQRSTVSWAPLSHCPTNERHMVSCLPCFPGGHSHVLNLNVKGEARNSPDTASLSNWRGTDRPEPNTLPRLGAKGATYRSRP